MKKVLSLIFAAVLLLSTGCLTTQALDNENGNNYAPYFYNYEDKTVAVPEFYSVDQIFSGYQLIGQRFQELVDIVYGDGRFYLLDRGTNLLVIADEQMNVLKQISTFSYQGKDYHLNAPMGVAYANGNIYVSDTGNAQIVCFDATTFACKSIFGKPVIPQLADNYSYEPHALSVDYAGRLYVICRGINYGLVQLDQQGQFTGFLGAPSVVPSLSDIFWRRFATKEQRKQMNKLVPTEYNSVYIDDKGALFVTSQTANIPPIAKLNMQGTNILVNQPEGDGEYLPESGPAIKSYFVDIIARADGSFLALDAKMGRIFTYSAKGELLSIDGYIGSQKGAFYSPSAIEYVNDTIYVTDKNKGTVTTMKLTDFGRAVYTALVYEKSGEYSDAEKAWNTVLGYCSNYSLAQISLAKIESQNGNYLKAMEMLSDMGEKENYSIAFSEYRNQWIKDNFILLFVIAIIAMATIVLVPIVLKKVRGKKQHKQNSVISIFQYGKYCMFHPFDGFWDLKRESRGSLKGAVIISGLALIFYAIRVQFSGYLLNTNSNILYETALVALPFLLVGISNFCFTTLMDGKGTMKDIYIFMGYALTPYVIISPLLFVLSHVMTLEELMLYTYIDVFFVAWVFILLFVGMMVTHDYSLGKAIVATVLTLIGVMIIIFIGLLFVNVIQEVMSFFLSIYKEIMFRAY